MQICVRLNQLKRQIRYKGNNNRDVFRNQFPSKKGRWQPFAKYSDIYEYTTEPLNFHRTGGRGPNGRIWNHKSGKGVKREFRWIDFNRTRFLDTSNIEDVYHERVAEFFFDKYSRTAKIALVINGINKRWIIACEDLEIDQIITTSCYIPDTPIFGLIGNAYPVGALVKDTIIHCLQSKVDADANLFRAAGTYGQIIDSTLDGKHVLIRGNDQRNHTVDKHCIATVGRVSNIEHDKERFTTFGQKARFGIKQRSGVWHKKRVHKLQPRTPVVINPKYMEKSNYYKMVLPYEDNLPKTSWTDWPQSYYDDRVKDI
ncbi:39S ribosomal protein L2, mitochondrial [Intoshia linei]|uniref:39S ribosomal protein L2, mitochondrial n=1 Tax=Intoshia linei TaxID=1819745 RepID=A0A177B855_9BILA|nr:39S ribosomal protein L2, mitochondrial [Intoshia linei]